MSNKRPVKIFRVPRSDTIGGCTILHIQPQAATIELNVKITATDGEVGYSLDLKENKVGRLQDEVAHQSEDEWKSVLRAALLADPREEDLTWKLKLEMTSLLKGTSIVIELRQDINGIKQRLGFLEIPSDDEVEVELWQWLDETCKEKDDSQFKLRVAEEQLKKQLEMVEQLSLQLQDLITAKKEHEEALIVRFQLLLNEKKKKLRDQTMSAGGITVFETSPSISQAESPEEDISSKRKGKRKAANDMVEDTLQDMDIGSSEADERLLQSADEDFTPDVTEDEEAIEDSYVTLDKKKSKPQTTRAIKKVIGKNVKHSTTTSTTPKADYDDFEMGTHDGDESDEEL